ncbi:LysR family glycine cleavage system transcriptional activator [Ensifer mexicanus]|nr:LysR family glycine cleavage system transcriptional activator [Sinorhizobium mexicanum]
MYVTERGIAYGEEVRQALDAILRSSQRLSDDRAAGPLTISTTPGFAAGWLCGHITEFKKRYPALRITIQTSRKLDDVSDRNADVFIAFGNGDWPNMRVKLLFEIELTPVCSPALLHLNGGLAHANDLGKLILLHVDDDEREWERWLSRAQADVGLADDGIRFHDANLAYAAAVHSQGVALGDDFCCAAALTNGLLVKPFGISIKAKRSYYLVSSKMQSDSPAVAAFQEWIQPELVRKTVIDVRDSGYSLP